MGWIQALQLIGNIEGEKVREEHIEEILQTIDEQGLMSPLMVIRTLAGSPLSNLGNVRPYLLSVCQSEQKQVDEHARVIEQYRVETSQVRQRIHDLQSQALTLKQTKCFACGELLELPTVHFLCDHSYHSHCFSSFAENDSECPACLNDNKKILDIVKSQAQSREQHDAFHSQLEKSDDGFAVVADYFGRGMFRGQTFLESAVTASGHQADRRTAGQPASTSADRVDRRAGQPAAAAADGGQTSAVYLQPATAAPVRKSPVPVIEEKPISVSTRRKSPNQFGSSSNESSTTVLAGAANTSKTAGNTSSVGANTGAKTGASAQEAVNKNPFGTPEESPEKDEANPFGEPLEDEDYDETLNPFA